MSGVRKSVFSGSWYPGDAEGCEREIKGFLQEGLDESPVAGEVIGGIVPHAGWYYSGSIACNVIASLAQETPPDIVAIFGMHLHPGSANHIMTAGRWETPFGKLDIAENLATELAGRFPFTVETTEHFTHDNTIELQLPFINYFYPQAQILPMGVPPTLESLEIGRTLVTLAKDQGLVVKLIGSTDLTHYGPNYGFTNQGRGAAALNWVRDENDRKIVELMLAMDAEAVVSEALTNQNACCAGAAATAIAAAEGLGAAKAQTLHYATSYDKSPGESFVGYVGILFHA
jgi:AmmeMemoRadiSam system protein B